MLNLSRLDRNIIRELITDARQPSLHIAKKVNATRQTIAKKISKFVHSGIISGFTIKLNAATFGLTIQAYILIREGSAQTIRTYNESVIEKLPQVSRFHRLFGKYSGIIEALVKDMDALTELVKRLHGLQGILETETLLIYNSPKDRIEDPFLNALSQ
ncbi:MAG: Lrp/AsnC family transcriptional regulator [Candidatus Bathyarchaeota archaeon]|nr:MAG: Lrp/AsnC family transcriptional regulator [Candidatus Bathyarchaeota archaeon]